MVGYEGWQDAFAHRRAFWPSGCSAVSVLKLPRESEPANKGLYHR